MVEAPAMAMLNPMLIDQKWSLSQIGVLMSVIGAGVGLIAAVSAAFIAEKNQSNAIAHLGRVVYVQCYMGSLGQPLYLGG